MKILVTGSNGFIGKNLSLYLKCKGYEVLPFDIDTPIENLPSLVKDSDFIIHLAGINRPMDEKEFMDGNVNFSKRLIDTIKEVGYKKGIIFSSSTQAEKDNPYGLSKKMAEDLFLALDNPTYVYRLYNVFGKWCRPNYNSVIATFSYNYAHDLPIEVNEKAPRIDFIYIDDVIQEFERVIKGKVSPSKEIMHAEPHYNVSLKEIVSLLDSFKEERDSLNLPLQDGFSKKLYATYLSYLDMDKAQYALNPHSDKRGSFTEMIRTDGYGQYSVNVIKPHIVKGNHFHMSKNEKYIVLKGKCVTRMRKVGEKEVFEIASSGDEIKVISILPGYTHNIENVGEEDAIVFMWASESFDENNPDTYKEDV